MTKLFENHIERELMKRLPAEWEEQSFIQLIFPPKASDWQCCYDEVVAYYQRLIQTISRYEKVVLVVENEELAQKFADIETLICPTNDTWARDMSVLTIEEESQLVLLNFHFNGWGGKFDARLDDAMSTTVALAYKSRMRSIEFILEGGAIESNGEGIILATKEAVLNPNRQSVTQEEVESLFAQELGAKKVLWLEHGYLAGDDTDSHIDTLARFIGPKTIAYVRPPSDKEDEHFESLTAMQAELHTLRDLDGNPFELVALPFCDIHMDGEDRLPATYANFLFVNGALLVPIYNDSHDQEALDLLAQALPNHDVVGVESSVLIKQHGSLHCISMQFPKGVK